MAKRQPKPPPPDYLRDNPEYRGTADDLGREFGTTVRLARYMADDTTIYTAIASNPFEVAEVYASGDTPAEALRALRVKLSEPK